MCTLATWKNNGVAVVSGRSLDWHADMRTNLWALPAGSKRFGLAGDINSLDWTSKYGSVVATAYDIASCDGINTKGLGAHLLWLAESKYPARNITFPALAISLWAQYFLDNFATVAEAIEHIKTHPFQVVTSSLGAEDIEATAHLALDDADGNMAVFEYIDGALHVHHDRRYEVMTNSPGFDQQLANLKHYQGFGGSEPLPGTTAAADRFVRAAYYLHRLTKPKDTREAVAGILSVVRNTSQPFGEADPKQPNISPTLWRTVSDHTNLVYYFESTTSPNIVWADLSQLNLRAGSGARKLDLQAKRNLVGEVSHHFAPAAAFTPMMPK